MKDLENEMLEWQGVSYKTILSREVSGGVMTIVDSVSPPMSGPPLHVHDNEDEVFVILSGEIIYMLDGKKGHAGPGETLFIPRGVEHTFQVPGDVPCRHLVILTPGGFEGFFAEMAKHNFAIPADMDAVVESAARHGCRFTGPPMEV